MSILTRCKGVCDSITLDLYDQWRGLNVSNGQFRFTAPTHAMLAFSEALRELEDEGGVSARFERLNLYLLNSINGKQL